MTFFNFLARLVVFVALASFSWVATAADILAVVSPRNTADVLSGAHQFLKANSNHRITLRTTDQFNGLEESERLSLFRDADLVFIGGVYGDSVPLFKSAYAGEC